MTTKWVEIQRTDSQSYKGYLALPPAGKGPGIVLVQEIWGVNRHIRAVAEQFALNGFVVLAPDVFWRLEPGVDLSYDKEGTSKARELMGAVDFDRAGLDVATAIDFLREYTEVTGRVGVVGFCMGGQLAYRAAAVGRPDVAISYYGGGIQNILMMATNIHSPILFHYAGLDNLIPENAVNQVKATFQEHSGARFVDYPDADHGFNCWARPTYHQRSATLAHGHSLLFLGEHLCS